VTIRYYYGRGLNALHNGSPKAIEQWRKAIEEGAGPVEIDRCSFLIVRGSCIDGLLQVIRRDAAYQ
jgi:hypothetical protein